MFIHTQSDFPGNDMFSFRWFFSSGLLFSREAASAAALLLLLVGCQADEPGTGATPGAGSGEADTAVDTTPDTADDTAVDTADDTAVDTADDTAVDTAVDTADDTAVDTADDTAVDTGGGGPNLCGGTVVLSAAPGASCNECGSVWTCDGPDALACTGGTLPCIDDCPLDPLKTEPGLCGCGVADDDFDGDALVDCLDGCPTDADKLVPALCGCGVADTDTDLDSTPDCLDTCPADPAKIAAGACGCGIAETDTDLDGTPNCTDTCPTDPAKVAAGACGCGIAETDTDLDGTPNCTDTCPTDPAKVAAGTCGCGVAETDGDADGTRDCVDGCASDRNKTVPGICGCGVADTDSDVDGTPNCLDACPTDATKLAAGVCGCGIADTDSDLDGTLNCLDACPTDATKVTAGLCGCGISDTDSDLDGVANCSDSCPSDAAKTAPGICGCGVAETDRDADGTRDCVDGCASDRNKTAPGICGCGVADTDGDADGVANCIDGCPADRTKSAPGICGCGIADTDTDRDGAANCNDGCPTDATKTGAGLCGCGVPDTDSDSDGTPDCLDQCPTDPSYIAEGVCGCGPETFLAAEPVTYNPLYGAGSYVGATASWLTTDNNSISCTSGTGASDDTMLVQFPTAGTWCIDTHGSTNFDTVIGLFSCGAELACNDDSGGLQSQLEVTVEAIGADGSGPTYEIVVDGYNANASGSYQLNLRPGPCQLFAQEEDCETPGDEDRNGLADCDDQAACADSCDCDVDGDGIVGCLDDCDFDTSKSGPGACGCGFYEQGQADAVATLTGAGTVTGSTSDATNIATPSCAEVSTGPDEAIDFTATTAGTWCFSTAGSYFDTVLWGDSCLYELNCSDDRSGFDILSAIELNLTAGQAVRLFVSGYGSTVGDYRLTATQGNCGATYERCTNGIDDDGDSLVDCADPACQRTTALGNACLKTATTVRTGALSYDYIGPNSALTDWGAVESKPATGMLVASYRGTQLLDTAVVGSTGSFSIAVPTTPISGDQIVYWAMAERIGRANLVVANPNLAAGEQAAGDTGSAPSVWSWSVTTSAFVAGPSRQITDAGGSGIIQTFLTASAAYLRGESVLFTPKPVVIWAAPGVSWDCGACAWDEPTTVLGATFEQQVVMPADYANNRLRADAVTAHELGHSVMDAFGKSPGEAGTHILGYTVQPGMAWSEGWATYNSSSVRQSSINYDKQGGGFFWTDIEERAYSGTSTWSRPYDYLPLTQAIDENEVAAMTWRLEQKTGWTSLLRTLASERLNMTFTPRGYTQRTWTDPTNSADYVDTYLPSRHFADALDAMLCNDLIAPSALWSVTEPWGYYPYDVNPLCF